MLRVSLYVISVLFCYTFLCVCLLMPCGHLLGKGWPLGFRLWCLIVKFSLSVWCGAWMYRFLIFALFVNSLPPGKFFMYFCRLLIVFQNQLFWKNLLGISSEYQTEWIQVRPDILLGLIWVQTVCKSYQQTTLEDKELKDLRYQMYLNRTWYFLLVQLPCSHTMKAFFCIDHTAGKDTFENNKKKAEQQHGWKFFILFLNS